MIYPESSSLVVKFLPPFLACPERVQVFIWAYHRFALSWLFLGEKKGECSLIVVCVN